MKKLLYLVPVIGVLILTGCNEAEAVETVCIMGPDNDRGTFTTQSVNGGIVSFELLREFDVTGWGDEEIEAEIINFTVDVGGTSCEVENNTLVCSGTGDDEFISGLGLPTNLDDYLRIMELSGAECH